MNQSEQDFESLKQLLKLKRHEIPPPGYFNNFADRVITGIQDEQAGGVVGQPNVQASWLVRFLSIFDSRPGLLGGLATSMVLLLVFGVVLTDHSDTDTQGLFTTGYANQPSSPSASATLPNEVATTENGPAGGITISTNPIASLQPSSSLFGQDNSLFQNASFPASGSPAH